MTTISFPKMKAAYDAGRLLDLEMPDGRALRSFTTDDCYNHAGWLRPVSWRISRGWIGRRSGRNLDRTGKRTVADVYSENILGLSFLAFHTTRARQAEVDQMWANFRNDRPAPGDEYNGGDWKK